MNPTRDPLRFARRRARATWAAAAALLVLASSWAVLPRPALIIAAAPLTAPSQEAVTSTKQPLDLTSFDVTLWTIPPVPVAAAPDPTPSPVEAVKYELIGIVQDNAGGSSTLRAAIYDPKSDSIFLVALGDRLGAHTVSALTESTVELVKGRSVTTLLLARAPKRAGKKAGRS